MKKILMALALSGLTFAGVTNAQAVSFIDNFVDSNTTLGNMGPYGNTDHIGTDTMAGAAYNMIKTEVTVAGSKLTFDLYSLSVGGYFSHLDEGLGKLFLDTNGGTTWNYVVDLVNNSTHQATLYKTTDGTVLGGTIRTNQAARFTTTSGGTAVDPWNITLNAGGYDYLRISVDLAATGWDSTAPLGFHWTMKCGNDVVQDVLNPVPEPTTILLFGTGLAGLAGFARRRVRK